MNVLIYEADHGGHRFTAVRMLIDALLTIDSGRPLRLHLATTAMALASDEFAVQLAARAAHFQVVEIERFSDIAPPLVVAMNKIRTLGRLVARSDFDHLFIPYADGLVQFLGLLRCNPWSGWPASLQTEALMMRGAYAYGGASRLASCATLLGMRLAACARIHLIDPLPHRYIVARQPALAAICRLMPDPTPTPTGAGAARAAARAALGIPIDGRLLGCLGRIDDRKGADLLVNAFLDAGLAPTDRLLLAGRHSAALRAMVDRLGCDRIISLDRYLDESDLARATGAIDLMVTPYPNFVGSASIVIRAAAAARMCLGSDTGWMGYVIPRFDLGRVCTVTDAASFAAAIEPALAESATFALSESAERFVRYFDEANVHAHFSALLRERLRLPAATQPLPWPDPSMPVGGVQDG